MADEQKPAWPASPDAGSPATPPAPKPPVPAAASKPAAAPKAPPPPAVMASTPWDGELPSRLREQFGELIVECAGYVGQSFVLEFLKLEADFDYLVDVTAVDYPKRAERFDLFYIVYSFARNERIRVKTQIKDGYRPETAFPVHPTANWLEREVYDMFGIEFAGHPDLRRILMPEDWQGHPLRKDSSILNMDNRWVRENLGIESGQ